MYAVANRKSVNLMPSFQIPNQTSIWRNFEVTSIVEPGIHMTQSVALNSLANQREMLGVRSHIQSVFKNWLSCGGYFVCAHRYPYDIVSEPLQTGQLETKQLEREI
jgi:hypothetical protein